MGLQRATGSEVAVDVAFIHPGVVIPGEAVWSGSTCLLTFL